MNISLDLASVNRLWQTVLESVGTLKINPSCQLFLKAWITNGVERMENEGRLTPKDVATAKENLNVILTHLVKMWLMRRSCFKNRGKPILTRSAMRAPPYPKAMVSTSKSIGNRKDRTENPSLGSGYPSNLTKIVQNQGPGSWIAFLVES